MALFLQRLPVKDRFDKFNTGFPSPFHLRFIVFLTQRPLLFRSFIISLLLALLAGCATQATIEPSSAPDQQIAPGQGAVAFRLSVNGPSTSISFQFWQGVSVQSMIPGVEQKTYEVAMSPLGASSSATYFGALPPGQYRIAAFSNMRCGAMCVTSNVQFGQSGPVFNVEKGKITYLGNMIYGLDDTMRSPLVASPLIDEKNFRRWMDTYYPSLAALPVHEEKIGNAAAYQRVQDAAPGFTAGTIAPDGTALFAAMSGSIRVITASAGGRVVNTGLMSRISTILALSPSHWLVAGDFGEVRETFDRGASWQPGELNLPYGAIRSILKGREAELVAFIQQKDTLDIYTGKAGGSWSKLSSTPYGKSMRDVMSAPAIKPLADGKRAVALIPSDGSLLLDLETYSSTPLNFPGGVLSATLSADGVLRCRCNRSGLWMSTWDSLDLGKSWQDSKLDRYLPLPEYSNAALGFNTQGFDIVRTVDGGNTWGKVHAQEQPYWPYILTPYVFQFLFIDERHILATDGLFKLLASSDGGATWTAVRLWR